MPRCCCACSAAKKLDACRVPAACQPGLAHFTGRCCRQVCTGWPLSFVFGALMGHTTSRLKYIENRRQLLEYGNYNYNTTTATARDIRSDKKVRRASLQLVVSDGVFIERCRCHRRRRCGFCFCCRHNWAQLHLLYVYRRPLAPAEHLSAVKGQ